MDINTFTPISGRIIGEDGQTHNLVDLLTAIAPDGQLASKPHLWAADNEYDFGDGTYGRRFIRTTWINDMVTTPLWSNMGSNVNILAFGGYIELSVYPYNAYIGRFPIGQAMSRGTVFASGSIFLESIGEAGHSMTLYIHSDTSLTSGATWRYDVWIRYTR
jgi:hypothetical protein